MVICYSSSTPPIQPAIFSLILTPFPLPLPSMSTMNLYHFSKAVCSQSEPRAGPGASSKKLRQLEQRRHIHIHSHFSPSGSEVSLPLNLTPKSILHTLTTPQIWFRTSFHYNNSVTSRQPQIAGSVSQYNTWECSSLSLAYLSSLISHFSWPCNFCSRNEEWPVLLTRLMRLFLVFPPLLYGSV